MRQTCKPPRFSGVYGSPLKNIMPKIWLTRLTGISSRLLFPFPSHFLSTIPIPVPIPMNSVYASHSHGIPMAPMGIPVSCTPVPSMSSCNYQRSHCAFVDLENMYNCSCEKVLMNDSRSLRRRCNDTGHLYHLLPSSGTGGPGTHAQ